ncbi:MAG: Stk1 family PASTA domain-containing Ser/Thr kinase [Propionibacteriaceae bacterium]
MNSEPVLVGGRYRLGDPLGRGGMAEVRQAVDTRLGRSVAVKQLRSDLAGDPTFQARFRREAQSAAGLNHPTIVAVYDTGEEPDPRTGVSVPYIVMELVDGPTLRDVLRDGRKILPERALELTQGVLDALSYSHKAGIVHRDIKPANVMLTPTGGVKVMDFGIARAVADTSATMTQTAAVIGTAQYLSPEQARGETVDARSDIYSAGCLLYELLVGRPPFTGDSPVSVAYQHVRERPVPPSELDSLITPEIDAITLKALAKDPADRYQNAREMKADITRLLAGQQVTAALPAVLEDDPEPTRVRTVVVPPTAPAEKPLPTHPDDIQEPKRRTGLAVLIVALVVLLVGAGAYGVYQFVQPRTPVVKQVTVPSVLGYNQAQAESMLRNAQLVPAAKAVNGPADSTVDTVTKQTPLGSTQAPANSTVTVEVNQGPKMTTIPDGLVGKDKDAVVKTLEDANFDVTASVATSEPQDAKKDEVLTVTPAEGTSVAEGSPVTVTYASGQSTVPSFVGSNRFAADSLAEQAGFDPPTYTDRETADADPGTVLEQQPAPGTKASRATKIKLVVAKAPGTPTPPTGSESPPATVTPPPGSSSPGVTPPTPGSTPN